MEIKYDKAIETILLFKKKFNTSVDMPKIPTNLLIGELGEFYVLQKLITQRLNPEHKGGHGGYDILVNNKRIEVKTSLLKNEGEFKDKEIRFWGWKVENVNQKKSEKFDYLVGVALDDNFSNPQFYIFSYTEAMRAGDVSPVQHRYRNIKRKIWVFENNSLYKKALKYNKQREIITSFEQIINRNPSNFLNKWGKIK